MVLFRRRMSSARRASITATVLVALIPTLATAQKRAITHEDVWLAKRLGTPALSPDGQWAALQVTEPTYEERAHSDIWMVRMDGSTASRRLTSARGDESGPAWSHDSRRLAFSARRDGDDVSQIYVIDVAQGGEAVRVTNVSTGARAPRWRPDGNAILFTSDVYPGAKTDADNKRIAEERTKRKWNARVFDTFPIRDWDRWLDDRRPSLFVQSLKRGSPFDGALGMPFDAAQGSEAKDILAGSKLMSERGFAGQSGTGSDNIAAAWTPDGAGVVFAATINRHETAFTEMVQSLWLVPAAGGEAKRLTTDRAEYGAPRFSRDGRLLYATYEPHTERVHNLTRLVRWGWPQMDRRLVVTASADRNVAAYVPAPDGASVHFLSEDQGHQKLFVAPAAGGAVRELGTLERGSYGAFDLAGPASAPVVVANWESAVNPAEVGRVDVSTGRWTPLTRFSADRVADIDWQPLQEFWFTSRRGARIHNFVALPPAFDATKKYPLFIVIHGGPHSMWIDQFVVRWNYHLLAQPGYVVLLTNYTGSTGFGEQFAQAIQGDPLEGPGAEVNEAAGEAIKRYPFIDATRQAAGGASYGGHLTNWLGVTTSHYRSLISHAGLFDQAQQWGTSDVIWSRERNAGGPPWENAAVWTKQNPLSRAGNLRTPMLVTVGERDYRVPMNNAIQLWSALQRMKVPSRLIVFPEENHWVLKGENSRFFYGEVHAWLARWFATPPSN
jgi:dipeptidyl aminopeptidase/acylaminoacyl peptidase